MSWLERLTGAAPQRRIARAERLLLRCEFNNARLEVSGLEDEEARVLFAQATEGLQQLNLQEWLAQQSAGNRAEAGDALARARRLGATPEREEEALSAWRAINSQPRSRPRR